MNETVNDNSLAMGAKASSHLERDCLREQKRETRYLVYLIIGLFFLALALLYPPTIWVLRSSDASSVASFVFISTTAIAINFLYRAHKENPHKPLSTFDDTRKKPQS